ncbi:HAD family hydrolase [Actinopolymorpha sp. NPDC004070]|uniref:HAD family hydrolase n=1 Tax=Actinopolymorpha sp. NPDC004070 TaxID=3154548 RepID=UPI0033A1A543
MTSDQPTSPMQSGPTPVRGVLFDIDDTLFDYTSSETSGLLGHLAALGLLDQFEPGELVAVWRRFVDEEHARFLAGEQTFTEQQLSRTRRFLAHLGHLPDRGISDAEAAAWFAGYVSHRNASWAAFPDAAPLLELLATDYRLGVISNSSHDHQLHKLERIGLLPYFGDAIVCSESHGPAKPHPSIFLAGCERLGLPPHEVAYVGDKYAVDAVGARDAGLQAYWLDRTGAAAGLAREPGIQVITSLAELPALLRLPAAERG